MVENEKSKDDVKVPRVAPTSSDSTKQDDPLEITDADEKAGAEMVEKILSVLQNPKEETSIDTKAEFQEKLARQQADFDNFRKRMEKEKQEIIVNANANLISDILPTLDHFELALKHNKDPGVKMIYDELKETLEKFGLKVIKTDGVFNPNIHEVVIKVEGDKDGAILEELQKGYFINDKLLRASKVKISKVMEKK